VIYCINAKEIPHLYDNESERPEMILAGCVMNTRNKKLLLRLIPFVMVLIGLFLPSCGFIGLLFDGDDEDKSPKYYDIKINYNYLGGKLVTENTPLIMLLIPLDSNMQFTDEGFDNATVVRNNFEPGVTTVLSLEGGPYAILGFIDDEPFGIGDGQVNMGEVYSFYDMRQFVDSIPQPDHIWVDSYNEDHTYYFEMDDSFIMDGFLLISPRQGDTMYGDGIGYIHAVGFQIDPTIEKIEILVDSSPQGTFPVEQEIFPVNMSTFGTGPHSLDIIGYDYLDNPIIFDQLPLNLPVNFDYVAP
jgi:hypothetical protein